MRFSTATVALLAGLVASQSILPISQISDGQIQAPPATPTAPVVVPSSAPVVSVPAVVTPSVVVPKPTSAPVVPTPAPAPVSPGNSTLIAVSSSVAAAISSALSSASKAAGSAASSASVPQQSTGAAAENIVSFGGVAFALVAAVFA